MLWPRPPVATTEQPENPDSVAAEQPENPDVVMIQGQIFKRGAREGDSFKSRWIIVTPAYVAYSKFNNTRVIDRIQIDEVRSLFVDFHA